MMARFALVRSALLSILLLAIGLGCGGDDTPPGAGDGGARDGEATLDGGVARDAGSGDASVDATMAEDAGPACTPGGLEAGDHTLEIDFDGRSRTYHLHLPPSYDGTEAVPLVFDFHGYTSNASQQRLLSRMTTKADEEGFATVHAEGIGGLQSWNGGLCCGDAASMAADDVGLVRAMLEAVAAQACIDRARVYAAGMSNGGFLSHRLGCQLDDVIAAIAPVAGVIGIPTEECAPSRAVPVMHFHGTSDTIVPYGGGGAGGFPSVAETMEGWRARNGCGETSTVVFDMGDSVCEAWTGCTSGAEVVLCTVDRGGHWWPGGPGSTADVDATDAMWEFFVRHPMP